MFFLVGVVYDRTHTRDLRALGGLLNADAAVRRRVVRGRSSGRWACPGSAGSSPRCSWSSPRSTTASSRRAGRLGVVLTAGYILWTLQRVYLGRSEPGRVAADLTPREVLIAGPLVLLTVALGVFPQALVLRWIGPSVNEVVRSVVPAKAPVASPPAVARR